MAGGGMMSEAPRESTAEVRQEELGAVQEESWRRRQSSGSAAEAPSEGTEVAVGAGNDSGEGSEARAAVT